MRLSYSTKAGHLIARLCVDKVFICTKHSKGARNVVSSCLPRCHRIPYDFLTVLLHFIFPLQMPQNFHISPLPLEIVSWVYKKPQLSSKPAHNPKEKMESAIGVGLIGENSLEEQSRTMCSWIEYQKNAELLSLSRSLKRSGADSSSMGSR